MLFPLNDTEDNRYGASPATPVIIGLCVVIWLLEELVFASDFGDLGYLGIFFLGTSPEMVLSREGFGGLTSITSTFLHGGFMHVLSNMWALWVFGRRVEDACGSWRFLAFYLFCGVTCALTFTIVHADSWIPAIGASGAIYGVMAAYLILYPEGRIRTLIFYGVPVWPKIRAFWVVLFFLVTEIPPALDVLLHDANYRTAHWGHVGGALGAVAILFFLRPEAFRRYINHLPI